MGGTLGNEDRVLVVGGELEEGGLGGGVRRIRGGSWCRIRAECERRESGSHCLPLLLVLVCEKESGNEEADRIRSRAANAELNGCEYWFIV